MANKGLRCCPAFLALFFLAALVGLIILFSNSIASSQNGVPMTIPIAELALNENDVYALTPTDSSSDLASLDPISDVMELNVTANIVVYFYYMTVTISLPEFNVTEVVKKNLSEYYTCSLGSTLFQLFPTFICVASALCFGNLIASLMQMCARKTIVLRRTLSTFIFLGFLFLIAVFAILAVGYFSSLCDLPSLKDQDFTPNAGFYGVCVALGANFLALIFTALQ